MKAADAVETCSPLGVARGDHKIIATVFTLANLPLEERTRPHFIGTAMLALNDDMVYFGATTVLGGCDDDLQPMGDLDLLADFDLEA